MAQPEKSIACWSHKRNYLLPLEQALVQERIFEVSFFFFKIVSG